MEFKDNGFSQDKTQQGSTFEISFALRTFNSTHIPRDYHLEINSSTRQYSVVITPLWPQQSQETDGGAGGGVTTT